jgi:molybdopterin synthase sulfur carrier subunit
LGTVKLYATLRQRAGGRRDIDITWSPGDSVIDVVRELLRLEPGLSGHILSETECALPYVSIFLNGRDIRYLGGLETALDGETEIAIFPPVAGGGG